MALDQRGTPTQVFSGSAHPEFAARVAMRLGTEVASSSVGRFNDGEVSIKINTSVRSVVLCDENANGGG